jgi:hypothetical protein
MSLPHLDKGRPVKVKLWLKYFTTYPSLLRKQSEFVESLQPKLLMDGAGGRPLRTTNIKCKLYGQ